MHEAVILPCIFGCEAVDSLEHYLCCDPMWTILISCSKGGTELLQSSPSTRLGFGADPMAWLQRLAIAFSCYHAINIGHRDEVDSALESGDPSQVHERLMNYARVFCLEFRECIE